MLLARFDRLRIQQKLTATIVLLLGLTAVFIVAFFPWATGRLLERNLEDEAAAVAGMAAHGSEAGLLFGDAGAVAGALAELAAVESASRALVLDAEGRPFARYAREGRDAEGLDAALAGLEPIAEGAHAVRVDGGEVIVAAPVFADGTRLGLAAVACGTDRLRADLRLIRLLSLGFSLAGLAVGLTIFHLITRRIVGPLRELDAVAQRVAAGEIEVEVAVRSGDEVGQLAATFGTMLDNIRASMREIERQRDDLNGSVETLLGHMGRFAAGDLRVEVPIERDDAIGRLCRGFNDAVAQLRRLMQAVADDGGALSTSAEELSRISGELLSTARESTERSSRMSATTAVVNDNIQSVASATEQMGASIREIARSSGEAAKVASEAVHAVESANSSIRALGDSSAEIGEVVKGISAIAEQTNLLALNATIEAARAGEAGKGFSVVASEVKDLARQTAEATQDIRGRIERIQATSRESATSIAAIDQVIGKVNQGARAIAGAVGEQRQAIQEIAANLAATSKTVDSVAASVNESTQACEMISSSVGEVGNDAASTAAGAQETAASGAQMNELAEGLMRLIGQFKV